MAHYIYKTTNLITGTYYIGKHTSANLENDYLGSGKILIMSIKKYGKENFKKEIWFLSKDRKSNNYFESIIVTEELIKDPLCMNIAIGGNGGKTWTGDSQPIKMIEKRRSKLLGKIPWNRGLKYELPKRKNIAPWNKGLVNCDSEETREKKSESRKGKIPWNKGLRGCGSTRKAPPLQGE